MPKKKQKSEKTKIRPLTEAERDKLGRIQAERQLLQQHYAKLEQELKVAISAIEAEAPEGELRQDPDGVFLYGG